jgi:hypothetical protein
MNAAEKLSDLRARVAKFLGGAYVLCEPSWLLRRYRDCESLDDLESRSLIARCLAKARSEAARLEGTTGPEGDAYGCYRIMAGFLEELQEYIERYGGLVTQIERLQDLRMRVSAEDSSGCPDEICPLEHAERNGYEAAIHQAVSSLEEARTILSGAVRRIEGTRPAS